MDQRGQCVVPDPAIRCTGDDSAGGGCATGVTMSKLDYWQRCLVWAGWTVVYVSEVAYPFGTYAWGQIETAGAVAFGFMMWGLAAAWAGGGFFACEVMGSLHHDLPNAAQEDVR
jgi:hypothetical protein